MHKIQGYFETVMHKIQGIWIKLIFFNQLHMKNKVVKRQSRKNNLE